MEHNKKNGNREVDWNIKQKCIKKWGEDRIREPEREKESGDGEKGLITKQIHQFILSSSTPK